MCRYGLNNLSNLERFGEYGKYGFINDNDEVATCHEICLLPIYPST